MRRGFTLIELMIVIAIIAIIAAIAIPGLLQSQRASNERNASASLKTLASAQADFRANDRDGNKVNDFWVLDVAGLYGVVPANVSGATEMIKLCEMSVAGADFNANVGSGSPTSGNPTSQTFYTTIAPKAGYWYRALINDEENVPYRVNTSGIGFTPGDAFNHSKFGVQAFPDSKSAGRTLFVINEGNTVFKRPIGSTYFKPGGAGALPPQAVDFPGNALAGTSTGIKFPADTELRSDYSKMD